MALGLLGLAGGGIGAADEGPVRIPALQATPVFFSPLVGPLTLAATVDVPAVCEPDDEEQCWLQWTFRIRAGTTTVRTLSGQTRVPGTEEDDARLAIPLATPFDGREAAGTPLPDGSYEVLLTVRYVEVEDGETERLGTARSAPVPFLLDATPPTLTATVTPPPNPQGWHHTDLTVTFTCQDATSGLATCPAPVGVSTEGAEQPIHGTATDRAGNSATTTVRVSLDKTPPVIAALPVPPANVAGWHHADLTVTFTAHDALSGLAEVTPPLPVVQEGADQVLTGTATDVAGNTATATATVSLDKTPPTLTALPTPPPNARGWHRSDVTVAFSAADALSGVASVSPPVTVTTEGAGQVVTGVATDRAGNPATASLTVHLDKTAPVVALTAPAPGTVRRLPRVAVTGTATDTVALAALTVAGISLGADSPFTAEVPLPTEGAHTLTAVAEDLAGNQGAASVTVLYRAPPVVTITAPADRAAFGHTPITVTGTVSDPQATVTVMGVDPLPATVTGTTFTAPGVPLREGGNVLTAVATDPEGDVGTASLTVLLDTAAPRVHLDAPRDGERTTAATIPVTGRIQDVVLGTINPGQATVTVNGRPAAVANRTFLLEALPLAPGPNPITATATDAVGNADTVTIVVHRETPPGPRLTVLAGSGQTAGIGALLPAPLSVQLTDAAGQPLPGQPVVFRVTENDGTLTDGPGTSAQGLTVPTDAQGKAQVRYTLGMRAGVGNHRVEATVPGLVGAALFTASATAALPAKINVDAGNAQQGLVDQPLPRPFVAVVTDAGHNRLPGLPVTFTVREGGGHFNGQEALTVPTDSDGRAVALLILGPQSGIETQVVEARVPTLAGFPATFVASAVEPGDPAETRISGVVLDNSNVPIPGVTLRIRGTPLATQSDAQGQFVLHGVPVGTVHLEVEGATAQRPGTWPHLEYELVTVPGQDNPIGMPIYLLPLDTAHSIFVDETRGGTLTLPDVPGFSLTVAPNAARFPDGTRAGMISVTVVHPDKVPMVPNFGQQPRFIVTIQPPGVLFNPPAAVTHPNVDGLPPGAKTELYSFDHDLGSFVATGTATVSRDGTTLVADPGTGILKGGWHCGGNPTTTGSAGTCPECKRCAESTCVADVARNRKKCTTAAKNPGVCENGTCREITVEMINVDARDPHNTRVNYRVNPSGGTIRSATFTAPGKTETRSDLSGDFFFTYDQQQLAVGNNILQLDADIEQKTSRVVVTANRTPKKAPPIGTAMEVTFVRVPVENVGLVLVGINHSLLEQFDSVSYSVPVVTGSRLIRVGKSSVNISTPQIDGVPTEIAIWVEKHMYRDDDGDHLNQAMTDVVGPTLPPQGPHFRSKDSFNSDFFRPDNNLTGIGEFAGIVFDSPEGLVVPFPSIIPPANKEVDVLLE